MHCQILICDQIRVEQKRHILGKVINSVSVPVFPYMIQFSLLLKIYEIPEGEDILTEFRVVDAEGRVLGSPGTFVHRNYRDAQAVPGVDQNFDLKVLVEDEGNIFLECYINQEKKNWYPIHVKAG
ncbi:hypothetical protein ACFFSY_00460 [Paenibacillus aurantiacus]|uniref:Uncharacterized protein n=1 Tax=Paenibacillus aurantiacus TaxID=1936118 RepID=A0ABV5KJW0_9BACL